MTVVELLVAARELISVPERWTQRAFARDEFGRSCGIGPRAGARAKCFCLLGAIMSLTEDYGLRFDAIRFLRLAMATSVDVVVYQDVHSHAEVLALCDHAIELARQAEVAA